MFDYVRSISVSEARAISLVIGAPGNSFLYCGAPIKIRQGRQRFDSTRFRFGLARRGTEQQVIAAILGRVVDVGAYRGVV